MSRGGAAGRLLGEPHLVTVQGVQKRRVVSREDELRTVRVGLRVLEQFDYPRRQPRVQAGIDLVEQQNLAVSIRASSAGPRRLNQACVPADSSSISKRTRSPSCRTAERRSTSPSGEYSEGSRSSPLRNVTSSIIGSAEAQQLDERPPECR